jgi:hypothetical protein
VHQRPGADPFRTVAVRKGIGADSPRLPGVTGGRQRWPSPTTTTIRPHGVATRDGGWQSHDLWSERVTPPRSRSGHQGGGGHRPARAALRSTGRDQSRPPCPGAVPRLARQRFGYAQSERRSPRQWGRGDRLAASSSVMRQQVFEPVYLSDATKRGRRFTNPDRHAGVRGRVTRRVTRPGSRPPRPRAEGQAKRH